MKTFRALSALLQYPEAPLLEAVDEIEAVIEAEALAPRANLDALQWLFGELRTGDLYEAQENYLQLFDRTRSLSLHLFEHIHGESRDRGQALVDLKSIYEAKGLMPDTKELPDFLPLFLEYLSLAPLEEARPLLAETAHVLTALAERLSRRRTPYEAVFRTLIAIAEVAPDQQALDALRQEPESAPDDLEALDAAWEEEAVTFGPGKSGCRDDLASKIRQGRRPAPGVEEQIRAARAQQA